MKSLIVGFALLVTLLFVACSNKNTIESNDDNENATEQTTIITKQTVIQTTESIIETVTESNITVDEYFAMLPEDAQTAFFDNGWTYEQSEESISERFYNNLKSVSGLTNYREKKIYVDSNNCKSILHEVGHRFEYESYVKGVYSDEFKTLYSKHWAEWYVNYGEHINNYDTIEEAYAQCFEIYFLKPNCLDKDTYNFIYQELCYIENSIF